MPTEGRSMSVRTRVNRLTKLRNFIAALPPSKFDMHNYVTVGRTTRNKSLRLAVESDTPVRVGDLLTKDCGTKCCLGGWAVLLLDKPTKKYAYSDIAERAQALLGISNEVAADLFTGSWPDGDGMDGTPRASRRLAVKTLDRLIANKGEFYPAAVA